MATCSFPGMRPLGLLPSGIKRGRGCLAGGGAPWLTRFSNEASDPLLPPLNLSAVHTQAPITLYLAYFSNHRTELGLALVRPSTACSPCCSQRNCNTPNLITSFPCFCTLTHNQLLSLPMRALHSLASAHHSASSLPLQWPCQTTQCAKTRTCFC